MLCWLVSNVRLRLQVRLVGEVMEKGQAVTLKLSDGGRVQVNTHKVGEHL